MTDSILHVVSLLSGTAAHVEVPLHRDGHKVAHQFDQESSMLPRSAQQSKYPGDGCRDRDSPPLFLLYESVL